MTVSGQAPSDLDIDVPAFIVPWANAYLVQVLSGLPADDPSWPNILNTLNGEIQTADQVKCFRRWGSDDALVDKLIPLAGGSDVVTRVPAALVLENVVDNTNICRVIHALDQPPASGADVNGRYDLLLAVDQVAGYAFVDTGQWISSLLGKLSERLKRETDVDKTAALLIEITGKLQANKSNNKRLDSDSQNQVKYKQCLDILGPDYGGPTP